MVSLVGSFHLLWKYWHVTAGFCCVASIHLASEGVVSTLREMFSDITGQWLLLLILKARGSYLARETTHRLRLLVIITLPLNTILLISSSLICYKSQWVNSCGCYGGCGSVSHFVHLVWTRGKQTEISNGFCALGKRMDICLKQAPTTMYRIS